MSAKKVKIVALRLPAAVQQLIKDGAKRSETTQPDFVQAALELAQEDMAVLDRVYERATQIRRDRTLADSVAAADANAPTFANYAEEWPVRPIGDEGEYDTIWVRWTHAQLDTIAQKFASEEYWQDRFYHWKNSEPEDQSRLENEWRRTLAGLPVPVRFLCWSVLYGISDQGRDFTVRDYLDRNYGMDEIITKTMLREARRNSLEGAIFELPFPLANEADGCKHETFQELVGCDLQFVGVNGVANITTPADWNILLKGSETYKHLQALKIGFTMTSINVRNMVQVAYPKTTMGADVEKSVRGDRMGYFRHFCEHNERPWSELIPKRYGDLFDEAPLSEQGGDPFTNRPRSKALYLIGFCLLSEETITKFWWDKSAIGEGVKFADLDDRCNVSKAAISKLLADWDTLFERELTQKGKPKRGGWIKLTEKGREFLTSATIAKGAGLPSDWMGKLLSHLEETVSFPNCHDAVRKARGHWQYWTTNFLANWRQMDTPDADRG